MPPNLRSVAAQVHRNSSWIRSRRNIPSDRRSRIVLTAAAEGAMDVERKGVTPFYLLTQGVKGYLGCAFVFGDVVKNLKAKEEESRMEFEMIEEMFNRAW